MVFRALPPSGVAFPPFWGVSRHFFVFSPLLGLSCHFFLWISRHLRCFPTMFLVVFLPFLVFSPHSGRFSPHFWCFPAGFGGIPPFLLVFPPFEGLFAMFSVFPPVLALSCRFWCFITSFMGFRHFLYFPTISSPFPPFLKASGGPVGLGFLGGVGAFLALFWFFRSFSGPVWGVWARFVSALFFWAQSGGFGVFLSGLGMFSLVWGIFVAGFGIPEHSGSSLGFSGSFWVCSWRLLGTLGRFCPFFWFFWCFLALFRDGFGYFCRFFASSRFPTLVWG